MRRGTVMSLRQFGPVAAPDRHAARSAANRSSNGCANTSTRFPAKSSASRTLCSARLSNPWWRPVLTMYCKPGRWRCLVCQVKRRTGAHLAAGTKPTSRTRQRTSDPVERGDVVPFGRPYLRRRRTRSDQPRRRRPPADRRRSPAAAALTPSLVGGALVGLGGSSGSVGPSPMALMISEMAASIGLSPIAVSGLIAMQAPIPRTSTVATTDRTMTVRVSRIAY
jgi:hypothetical protein